MRDRGKKYIRCMDVFQFIFCYYYCGFFRLCADLGLVDILNEASHSLSSQIECQSNHFKLLNGKF